MVEIPRCDLKRRSGWRGSARRCRARRRAEPRKTWASSIIRLADWFGITDIVCSPEASADCFANPRQGRTSHRW
ncbi:MAG: hypothetical protein ACLUYV_03895 [Alistipes shahii]